MCHFHTTEPLLVQVCWIRLIRLWKLIYSGAQFFVLPLLSKCYTLRSKARQWFWNSWFWGAVPDAPKYSSVSSLIWDTGVLLSLSWGIRPAMTVAAAEHERGLKFVENFTVLSIDVSFRPNIPTDAPLVTRTTIMVGVIPWNSSSKST